MSARTDIRRHASGVRKKVQGTTERPRLAVFRSNRHISAQVIDDRNGATVAAASTTRGRAAQGKDGHKEGAAAKVGELIAERAQAAGVKQVAFDRGLPLPRAGRCRGRGRPSRVGAVERNT